MNFIFYFTVSEDDEEEEEEGNEANNQNDNSDATSDCSLDESDFSAESSTTEVSSEHSDWGSDHDQGSKEAPSERAGRSSRSDAVSRKRSSPTGRKKKKSRQAAKKGLEKMFLKQLPGGDVGEAFIPSQWLSDTMPRKTPYFPQIGDVLMYFKSGHQKYIELVEHR